MEKRPFFQAATAGLGKYHATAGLGSKGLRIDKGYRCMIRCTYILLMKLMSCVMDMGIQISDMTWAVAILKIDRRDGDTPSRAPRYVT